MKHFLVMEVNIVANPEKLQEQHEHGHGDLKGTFTSVMLLGVLIIVSWIGVWLLFLSR